MKKGFTLIELLVIIIVIAVLAAIATPKLMGFLDDSKEKAYDITINRIVDAARLYVSDNTLSYIDDTSFDLTIDFLCTEKYLTCPIYSPKDKDVQITGTVHVVRTEGELQYSFIAE